MSDVFISWGGAGDKATVGEMASRLANAGLSVFEYTRSMDPGDAIDIRVMQEIDSAKAAIVCLSDTSIPREWVGNEIAWLPHTRRNSGLRAIVPVRTGAL
ncbi:MAG: toll/interleukin-1 receptor domain-containing protein [Acidobacteriia bacterium]|nr:toll/interleukin-1 receptor domain-containing protein [Terriglobia bacterium]